MPEDIDFIEEPPKGSLKGFLREKGPDPKADSERIYINRYAGKEALTKEEVLDQMSIWSGAMLIHECKR